MRVLGSSCVSKSMCFAHACVSGDAALVIVYAAVLCSTRTMTIEAAQIA